MKKPRKSVFGTKMLRKGQMLMLSLAVLTFAAFTSLSAQVSPQEFSNYNSGNSGNSGVTTAMTEAGAVLGDTDIDPGTMNSSVEQAAVYAKEQYKMVSEGQKYTGNEKAVASMFYREFATALSDAHNRGNSDVGNALSIAYNKVLAKVERRGADYINPLNDIAEQTVNELQ